MPALKAPKKRKRGRPRIAGKAKYTLNLTTTLVDGFWNSGGTNLSQFVDQSLASRSTQQEG